MATPNQDEVEKARKLAIEILKLLDKAIGEAEEALKKPNYTKVALFGAKNERGNSLGMSPICF